MARKQSIVEMSAFSSRQIAANDTVLVGNTTNYAFARNVEGVPGAVTTVQVELTLNIANAAGATTTALSDLLRCFEITIERSGGELYVDSLNGFHLVPFLNFEGGAIQTDALSGIGTPVDNYAVPVAMAAGANALRVGLIIPIWQARAKAPGEWAAAAAYDAGPNISLRCVAPVNPVIAPAALTVTSLTAVNIFANIDESLGGLVDGVHHRTFNSFQAEQDFTLDARAYRYIWLTFPTPPAVANRNLAASLGGRRVPNAPYANYSAQKIYLLNFQGTSTPYTSSLFWNGAAAGFYVPLVAPGLDVGVGRVQIQPARYELGAAPAAVAPTNVVMQVIDRHSPGNPGVPAALTNEQLRSQALRNVSSRKLRQLFDYAGRQAEVAEPKYITSANFAPSSR